MAYTPINWQNGDTITAEKMNKMDNGWGFENTQLFNETVTTTAGEMFISGVLSYEGTIDYDAITVTFNGTDYNCNVIEVEGAYYYGGFSIEGPDYTDYPFAIQSIDGNNEIFTQNAGTYTVAVAAPHVEVSTDFKTAVTKSAVLNIVIGETTWQEVFDALGAGRTVLWVEKIDVDDYAILSHNVSWAGETSNGSYDVRAIVYDGAAITAKRLSANSADGVLVQG